MPNIKIVYFSIAQACFLPGLGTILSSLAALLSPTSDTLQSALILILCPLTSCIIQTPVLTLSHLSYGIDLCPSTARPLLNLFHLVSPVLLLLAFKHGHDLGINLLLTISWIVLGSFLGGKGWHTQTEKKMFDKTLLTQWCGKDTANAWGMVQNARLG